MLTIDPNLIDDGTLHISNNSQLFRDTILLLLKLLCYVWISAYKDEREDLVKEEKRNSENKVELSDISNLVILDIVKGNIPFILGNCELDAIGVEWEQ